MRAETDNEPGRVVFSVSGDGFLMSRSVLSASVEDKVTSVTLAFYKNGLLESVRTFSGASDLSAAFVDDERRTVFALVNMASVRESDLPVRQSDLKNLTWRLTSYSALDRDGLPMADSAEFRPSDGTCTISVRRLVSRFSFSLTNEYRTFFDASERTAERYPDPSYLFKDMTYSLKNINGTLRPFGSSAAEPGDLLSDREFELTSDGTAVLYVPENRQGDLLSVSDPSEKTLESLRERYGKDYAPCASYVEVTLRHDASIYGVGGDLTYRFFLGNDNTRNFSVDRNLHYNVLFGPRYDTVMGCFDEDSWTWKVESGNWHDSRYLTLEQNAYSVRRGGDLEVPVEYGYEGRRHPENGDNGDLSAPGCDWRAYVKTAGQSDASLVHYASYAGFRKVSYDPSSGLLAMSLDNSVSTGSLLEIVLRTRDGRHEARAQVTVLPDANVTPVWSFEPGYVAQKPVLSLSREGTAVSVSSVAVTEGKDRATAVVSQGKCTLSLLKAGPVSLEVLSDDGSMAEVSFTVKTPLLKSDRATVTLPLDASSGQALTLSYAARAEDGGFAFSVASSEAAAGARSFSPSLYASYLKPVLAVGSGPLAPYLTVSGTTGYIASYDPAGMAGYIGTVYAGSFTARAADCADVAEVPVAAVLADPFPGFSADRNLGTIHNFSIIGFCPKKILDTDPFLVFTGEKTVEQANGPVLTPGVSRSNLSFRNAADFSFGLTTAGKITLTAITPTGRAVGKQPLTAVIRNARNTANTTDIALGYFECYLFAQLGAILERIDASPYNLKVSADLWGADEVAAFQSLRNDLAAKASVRPSFNTASYYLRSGGGASRNVWTLRTEESLDGSYTYECEKDANTMSTWEEQKLPGQSYKPGETVYTVSLRDNMATIWDYRYASVMTNRTTSPRLTCDLSGFGSLQYSDLGYHYSYGSERDAAGRSYYVCYPYINYFMKADVEH